MQDAPTKGAGDPDLKALMREVDRGVSGPRRVEVMEGLARIVGIPPTAAALELDYARFLVIRKQQAAVAAGKEMTVPGLDEDKHPEFMASRGQLLCGQVLGDAFGIHQVFAALLTPTGGLVGPGNWLIPGVVKAGHLDWDNPVALHGTVHDAAGYLLVFHGQGPGYNYRDSPIELLKTESPLSGQISGIAYWVWEAGDDYLRRRIAAAVMAVERGLREVRSKVAAGIDGLLGRLRALAGGGDAGAPGGPGDPLETAEAILDAQERAERCAVEPSAESGTPPDTPPATRLRDRARARLKAAWSVLRG